MQELVELEQITNIFYGTNRVLELDVDATLELMKDTSLEELDSSIVFFGKDFRIEKNEKNYECYFEIIKLSKPEVIEKVVPTTLKSREMLYSEEHSMAVPMITQSMIDEAKKIMKEVHQEYRSMMTEVMRLINEASEHPSTEDVEDFTIFEDRYAAYIVVPEFPAYESSLTITDDRFIDQKDRKLIDFIGYAGLGHGGFLQARFYVSYSTLMFVDKKYEEEIAPVRENALAKLIEDKKLVKVIGISDTMLEYRESPKEFLERNLDKIKEYYESR